jgi:Wiskott-Aldrich syndrome protein
LEAVRHCRLQPEQQPPTRGQVHPHAAAPPSAVGPPAQRPYGPRQSIQGHPFFPPPRPGAPRPQSPLGRGSPSRPPPPTDRTLRSRTRQPPDDRRPDSSPRGGRR